MKKVLLLGAGFSYELGMPLASELTDVFLSGFTYEQADKLINLLARNDPFGSDRPINKDALHEAMQLLLDYKDNQGGNYEELFSNIQNLANLPNKSQSDKDSYHYIFSVFYTVIHEILNYYQLISYAKMYPQNFPYFRKLAALCSEKETWAFTLNHDLYLECLALDFNIPITYGDKDKISFPINNLEMDNLVNLTYSTRDELDLAHDGFFKNVFGINLVKLHGGLSELEYRDGAQLCNQTLSISNSLQLMTDFMKIQEMSYYEGEHKVPSGKDRFITNLDGELDILSQSMLTGGSKYSLTTNEKRGEEKLKLFMEQLKNADELTIIGYGFGDKHINYRISNAMVLNENLKIKIVDPIHKPIPSILEQFNYNLRIITPQCGAPHWMEYVEEESWNREQMDIIEKNRSIRQEVLDIVKRKFGGLNA